MPLIVQKFGGSSLATAGQVMEAARKAIRARHAGNQVIMVVSAQGRTTDDLIAKAHEITAAPSAREMDMLLATGEQISIALAAMAIHELGERAISFLGPQIGLVTDNTHLKARIRSIDVERIRRALDADQIVVLAGFQGMDEQYDITTLGRGGSDTTAVAVAAAMKLAGYDAGCEIYTDVDGVYTADPRLVPDARKLDAISYDEMLEMASMGAGVMHSRSIEFARKFDVPLMVRNAGSDAVGTWIVPEEPWMAEIPVCGAALAADEARLVLDGVPDRPGVSHAIFTALADAGIAVDMIAQSVGDGGRTTIGFTVIKTDLEKTERTLRPMVERLGAVLRAAGRVSKVSIVGAGMRTLGGVAAGMFQAIAEAGVNMSMITTGDMKISVLIEEDAAAAAEPELPQGKAAHEDVKRAFQGRAALRAVHQAFRLHEPRAGAGDPRHAMNGGPPAVRPAPPRSLTAGMEDVLVDAVHLNLHQARVTLFNVPDQPGVCGRIFGTLAAIDVPVDMIVQTEAGPGRAELSITVPQSELARSLKRLQDFLLGLDPACRVVGDADIAVLSVLGVGMRTHTGVARAMFGALAARGINIAMINTSESCIGVAVDKARGEEAEECLRETFLTSQAPKKR